MFAFQGTAHASEAPILHKIHHYVHQQHKWAYWAYLPKIKYHYSAERTKDLNYRKWIQHEWRLRANATYDAYQLAGLLTPPWACIHRYEGSWNAVSNTVPTYYGGLQMDVTFQLGYNPHAYYRYGTADHWPVRDQVVAAKRAYAVRGYTPWPNTARYCGLL